MYSFRTELEQIKKVKSKPYEFEAERFLEGLIEELKGMDVSVLCKIKTLDFSHKCINGYYYITVASNKEEPFLFKHYSPKVSKELFDTIKDIVSRSYWITERDCSFSIDF